MAALDPEKIAQSGPVPPSHNSQPRLASRADGNISEAEQFAKWLCPQWEEKEHRSHYLNVRAALERLIRERNAAQHERHDLWTRTLELGKKAQAEIVELNQRLAERTAAYEARDAQQREAIRILRKALIALTGAEAPGELRQIREATEALPSDPESKAVALGAIDALLATA